MQKFADPDLFRRNTEILDSEARERARIEAMARRLYILAWVIEGVAVSLGLGMALSLNIPGESTIAEFFLGGGGFVMVACAELSKIPLATFLVEASGRGAKAATLIFLILMSFITFETIFMSLERGFDARMRAVHAQKEQLAQLKAEHAKLSAVIENPSANLQSTRFTIERELGEIDKALKSELDAIREERDNLRQEQRASGLPKEIQDQRLAVDARRKQFIEERDKKIAAAHTRALEVTAALHRELAAARRAADPQRVAVIQSKIDQLNSRAERTRIENDYQRPLNQLDVEDKALLDQRARLTRDGEAAIKPRLDELAQKEQRLHMQYGGKREELRKKLDDVHASEKDTLGGVATMIRLRDHLVAQIEKKENDLRNVAAVSQLHRIAPPFARWWTGKEYDPHTIPEAYVRSVAVIWFGSMAVLGAIGGSVVAMVSQLLRRRADKIGAAEHSLPPTSEDKSRKGKLRATLRRMLLSWRFSRVKTKTVEVVKTETKTVTKIVAVPVPVAVSGSHDDFGRLKKEYEALAGPLSETGSLTDASLAKS